MRKYFVSQLQPYPVFAGGSAIGVGFCFAAAAVLIG